MKTCERKEPRFQFHSRCSSSSASVDDKSKERKEGVPEGKDGGGSAGGGWWVGPKCMDGFGVSGAWS